MVKQKSNGYKYYNNLYYMATTVRNNTNERIYNRLVPSFKPQVQLETRPVQTKYTVMQFLDERPRVTTEFENRELYNVNKEFLPVAYDAPVNTFMANVDHESTLRNQLFALQRSDYKEYVPSSNSDLYTVEVVGRSETDNHPLLFEEYKPRNDRVNTKPKLLFNNNTSVKLNNK